MKWIDNVRCRHVVLQTVDVKLSDLKMQYNPQRFSFLESLHRGPIHSVLDIKFSPHVKFLQQYVLNSTILQNNIEKTSYYKMQVLYGRNIKKINTKIKKFIATFEDIKKNGFKGSIQIFEKPMHANPYNDSFEIYEGHHRVSCCYVLHYDAIKAEIINIK